MTVMNGEAPALPTTDEPGNERTARCPTHVVGIGASAGGLEALERVFERMPEDTGLAFVVVQHLSPDFKSLMDELLARKTRIPIHRAADGMQVEANAIYLIPPKKDMIIVDGRLRLTDKDPNQLVALPIDHFFRSLAQDVGECAVGIVLSGTGSDGSRGIRDIHEAGGLVIAQTPETAKFDGMPNSANLTGAVDLQLPPEQIPDALLKYVRHPFGSADGADSAEAPPAESGIAAVFRSLRDAYGIDFSHYKASTVSRRIERRLLLNRAHDLDDYVERLRADPEELNALYHDLLIGVTRFFRDAEAFARLGREVLPGLLSGLEPADDFRVWVAGCATGEEAYSLAILIQEQVEALGRPVNVKLFATDVHRASLDFAGAGCYTEAQLADVSPERLARWFVHKRDGYQVSHDLRQLVVFAPHNVIKDAPFTKLDLITCRNMLIYLQPPAQKKVLSLFHFALKTGGVLFLGPSESPGDLSDEFSLIDAHWKIYRKRRDVQLPAELRLPLGSEAAPVRAQQLGARVLAPRPPDHQLLGTYDALLDEFMPASVLVNERREVVQTFAGASKYLRLKDGRVTTDLLDMVDADLRIVLAGALARVGLENKPVAYKGLRLAAADGEHLVNLLVKPVASRRSGLVHALVVFEDQGQAPPPLLPTEVDLGQASREQLHTLEAELRYTKENLQATIEELETSNEELQATNEELVASNEELQSTNEELHSVNEELYTVNAEYQKKITELTALSADMDNLLSSTQVHTLFLDRDLCIRKFTPRLAETFSLLPQDLGRRIDSFSHSIDYPNLVEEIRRVMETGEPFEQQVRDSRRRWFLLRILPYQSGQAVEGVVLTLIDVAKLKQAEAEAREAVEHRDRFLAMLSHELRNPLGAIVNAASVLERPAAQEADRADAMQVIQRQSKQMSRLLDDLLDVSRITQNKIQLRRVPTQLDQLLEEALRVARPRFEAGRVALSVRMDEAPLVVNGDPNRLQQLLVNLLTNAAKYTPPEGRAEVELRRDGEEAVIQVRDTGVGIRADMLERVFNLFVQVDQSLDRTNTGLGVGLTLVRTIAELHGGRVRAASGGLGQGSEFTVWLPLAAHTTAALEGRTEPRPPTARLKIVVVEDNDDSRRMMESMLRMDGHEVHAARDGREGLAAILRERPQLALVDIGLPILDGYELARQVRVRLGSQLYLAALTGYGRPEDRRAVFEAGYDEHLVKPLKAGDLEQALQHAQK
ncbi:MAG: PAS domain-containing protein, partial [Planctomycetia bacterium]|nr:PAS domain-containing protein [Planctomycetia bacterium]